MCAPSHQYSIVFIVVPATHLHRIFTVFTVFEYTALHPAMSLVADLPIEVWKLIMHEIPLRQRLSSCALVCQKFSAAAAAATYSIEATLFEQPASESFVMYIQQHGSHLTSMMLTGYGATRGPVLEQLPCQHLRELNLTALQLKLGPDQDHRGVLDATTALTRLQLQEVRLVPRDCAASLSVPPNLQHLSVETLCSLSADLAVADSAFEWANLQHLTHLKLTGVRVGADSLRHISGMANLQVLVVSDSSCCMLSGGRFCLPPALQRFDYSGALGPSILAAATRLTRLRLDNASFQGEGGANGGTCFLRALPKLQQLDYLALCTVDTNWPPPSPAYQALVTCSSKLRVLIIEDCQLPNEAFAHVLPSAPSKKLMLPRLEILKLHGVFLDGATYANFISCCPSLRQLGIDAEWRSHLAALSQLSALTYLELLMYLEDDFDDDDDSSDILPSEAMQGVAELSQLRHIYFDIKSCPRYANPLPLTALRQLTALGWFYKEEFFQQDFDYERPLALPMNLKTQVGAKPYQ